MGIASLPLEIQLILVPTILFALTFHEYAHARVAYLLGDYTSYYQNRMNLNPFNHLDPFGTFALYFLGFGWAKPVPVVMQNLKNPRRPGGPLDPVQGITRTITRRILDRKGIEIGKKDPIDVFDETFGEIIV